MNKLIYKALKPYSIGKGSFVIERELHTRSWNRDLHNKLIVNGKALSARFIPYHRSPKTSHLLLLVGK